jgi:hypothetical protein
MRAGSSEEEEDATGIASVEQWNNKVHRVDQAHNDGDEWMAQSAKERNEQLIRPTATIHQADPGEAVMLIGKQWSELAVQQSDSGSVSLDIPAAIHKSPDQLLPWQRRVLLTTDVLSDLSNERGA